ncbi:MAG: tRNA preQ1(34) S-adenosylmethionine ribosyltransferase-isomerase QueA [Phycisphaerales bacterium]|nr:tRNA preQ1(34) S-adenosylmethionine ribosyltransferase-isomerase QueA [Phycisphaerales bacterium]
MRTEELDYDFDPALIATTPASPRDAARLMVVDRRARTIAHHFVRDLPQFLDANDTLFVNTTSVLRARLSLVRDASAEFPRIETEGLLLEPRADGTWRALIRQSKRLHTGERLLLQSSSGANTRDAIELIERDDEAWIVRLHSDVSTEQMLERSGLTPLPPYILKARRNSAISVAESEDRAEYETVYADPMQRHSVAAPTAGLHFTPELLQALTAKGVRREEVVLHVGAGTFKPIESTTLDAHPMHQEQFEIPAATIAALARPSRRIAVGTTSVRALESLPAGWTATQGDYRGDTRLLIQPGFAFRHTDAMLTNFHLPRSTLLALVGAFTGMELMREAYATAVRERYRFYSYGDAMLVV